LRRRPGREFATGFGFRSISRSLSANWISDPWVARGVKPTTVRVTVAPSWDPPDLLDEWPTFGAKSAPTSKSETSVTVKPHPGPSFGREPWQTHSLEGGPDDLSAVHNVLRHVT